MAGPFDYEVFGLTIRSTFPLPELFEGRGTDAPDVIIRQASISNIAGEAAIDVDEDALVLSIADVARYRIRRGREILVDPEPGVPERNIRLYLLGSAFGALLHQRGLLPLHANAVEIDGRAVAFMGESGAGKSTLAAWFHDRGFRVIADDVCVVRFDGNGRTHAAPGLPRLRLWEHVLAATGRQVSEYARSYSGDESFNKYDVPIHASAANGACELGAVFILGSGEEFAIQRLTGIEAIQAIYDNTYRGAFLDQLGAHQHHWSAAVEFVRKVSIYRLTRVWGINRLDEQCDLIVESLRKDVLL